MGAELASLRALFVAFVGLLAVLIMYLETRYVHNQLCKNESADFSVEDAIELLKRSNAISKICEESLNSSGSSSQSENAISPSLSGTDSPVAKGKYVPWYDVAAKTKTDKITAHAYDWPYEKYLPQYISKGKIKLLEIGLGCDMRYGPGESLKVWVEYFKDIELELHFLEYDAKCVEAWQPKYPHVVFHAGDQANFTDLARLLELSKGEFDVIIDDGGHAIHQQIFSFEFLFPKALKHGGYYFIEDVSSSFYMRRYNNTNTLQYLDVIEQNLHKINMPIARKSKYIESNMQMQILSVEHMREMVIIQKMPAVPPPGIKRRPGFNKLTVAPAAVP